MKKIANTKRTSRKGAWSNNDIRHELNQLLSDSIDDADLRRRLVEHAWLLSNKYARQHIRNINRYLRSHHPPNPYDSRLMYAMWRHAIDLIVKAYTEGI